MERMLRRLLQTLSQDETVRHMGAKLVNHYGPLMSQLAQRMGPEVMDKYGPLLGEKANDLIREHLPWWPF